MKPFTLTVFDPDEDYDDAPASLMPLGAWLAARAAGSAPFEADGDEGIGVLIQDGASRYLEEGFGSARALAFNLREAADRLDAGQVTVLSTSYGGPSAYLLLAPDEDGVRVAQVRPQTRPPGPWDPYHPGPAGSAAEQVEAMHRWAASVAQAELSPTDKPAADVRRGLELYLERDDLVLGLRRAADQAFEAAGVLGSRPFAGGDAWPAPVGVGGSGRSVAVTGESAAPAPAPAPSGCSLRVHRVAADADRMRLIQIIRTVTGLNYAGGKAIYSRAVDGPGFSLDIPSREQAAAYAAEMGGIGATVEVVG